MDKKIEKMPKVVRSRQLVAYLGSWPGRLLELAASLLTTNSTRPPRPPPLSFLLPPPACSPLPPSADLLSSPRAPTKAYLHSTTSAVLDSAFRMTHLSRPHQYPDTGTWPHVVQRREGWPHGARWADLCGFHSLYPQTRLKGPPGRTAVAYRPLRLVPPACETAVNDTLHGPFGPSRVPLLSRKIKIGKKKKKKQQKTSRSMNAWTLDA